MSRRPKPMERLDGTVLAIRYYSPEFTVALLQRTDGAEQTIVGALAGIEEGQRISAFGHARRHAKHGEQFRVDHFLPLVDASREGVSRFLVQEVEGIGPATAQRIVSYFFPLFGAEMLEKLQAEPARLREVPGLGERRAAAIERALHESFGARGLLLELYRYGVPPTVARSVLTTYEARGVDPLRVFDETPYQLVHDVPRVGFDRIDRIARQKGIVPTDPGRLRAAIVHLLAQAYHQQGHSYLPESALVKRVADLLWDGGVPADAIDRIGDALEVLQKQHYVQIVTVRGELAFYHRDGWLVEEGLGRELVRLMGTPVEALFPAGGRDGLREAAEARAGIRLGDAQSRAYELALGEGIAVITGGPGTGKSTLARLIVDSWEGAGLDVRLAAPTGRAARRLVEVTGRDASTIHRLLEWREGEFQRDGSDPIPAGAILVDEASMLDGPLARALLRAVPSGCRLLFIGDVDQLPSVGPGNVLRDLIESDRVPVARLDRIYRQDVSRPNMIVELAHAINDAPRGQGIPGGPVVARRPEEGNVFLFNTRMPWARCSCGGVRLPAHCPACRGGTAVSTLPREMRGAELIQHLVTERIPAAFGRSSDQIQVISPRYGGSIGVDELNERLRGALNPARSQRPELRIGRRHFRLGDRVMAIRNNYEKDVVNGLQGLVVDVEPGLKRVTVEFDGEVRASFRGDELDELTHAYAITAHKSQGGEYPVVLLALDQSAGRLLYRQLLYTAVTRARELLVLVGDPVALERATANNRPRHRWTGLDSWLDAWLAAAG